LLPSKTKFFNDWPKSSKRTQKKVEFFLKEYNDGTLKEEKGMSFDEDKKVHWNDLAKVILKQKDKLKQLV